MKLPLSWLKEFVPNDLTLEEIAGAFTMGGLEVEKIEIVEAEPIFEISLTPNLGHCMSIYGLARELSALLQLPLKSLPTPIEEKGSPFKISVEIEDKEQCFRYACRHISSVRVGPSPDWLKERLEWCNIRSVNNIVDITNYVMLEMGQPLHAYDLSKIAGPKIRVTSKTPYTKLLTLEEKEAPISQGELLIADAEKPLAFAGVIGGKESSITDRTETILLESAYFTPQSVRRTSKLIQVRTESMQRFEKEVDFEGVRLALDRAAYLIAHLTGGVVAKGVVDERARLMTREPIVCRLKRVNQMLGTQLSLREIVGIFKRLQMTITREEESALHVVPPSFRNDLKKEIDLIEEVGRLYGYQNIPLKHPEHITSPLEHSPLYLFEQETKERLRSEGLQECISCNLISPKLAELTAEACDPASWVEVLHPSSADQSILRTSLLPGLLQMVQTNHAHQNKEIAAFEVGKIHFKQKEQCREQLAAALICSGLSAPYHLEPKSRPVDFFDLKGKVENILQGFGIANARFEPSHLHNFHPGRQARIKIGELFVGALGEIHPARLHALGIDARVYFAELNLNDLFHLRKPTQQVKELPQFFGSERDWTLTVKEELAIGKLLELTREVASPLLESVDLLDIYRSPQLGKEKKNVTLRFFYRDRKKTISLESVEKEHAKITEEVAKKLDHLLH